MSDILHIPKKIRDDITERGFHLYKWISPEEVKLSIERDFLKSIKIAGTPLGVLAVLAGLISGVNFFVFFFMILVGVFFMFLYLIFLSLKRSVLLSRSAFVIMTDSSISLGGKIHKLSDISEMKGDIKKVSETFEEGLFEESRLSESKNKLSEDIMTLLFGGYKKIFDGSSKLSKYGNANGDDVKIVLILIMLYTLYAGVMACVYFVGVFFLWIFGNIITKINTWFLIRKGHRVLKINTLFGQIHRDSEGIKDEKRSLSLFLEEAQNNDWKDGLLLKIQDGIKSINTYTLDSIENISSLKHTINNSKYKEMFRFEIYNSWIKKQIQTPLEQIHTLLLHNKDILTQTQKDIIIQIEDTKKSEYKATLELQLQRVDMQLRDIQAFIPTLETSLLKLKS